MKQETISRIRTVGLVVVTCAVAALIWWLITSYII
jgi:hypothetical protein